MNRPLCLNAAVLIAFLLMSAGSASARTGGVLDANPIGSATQLVAIPSFVQPTPALNIWAISTYASDDDGHPGGDADRVKDKDKDKDHDGDDGHDRGRAPKPTPEPSTLFSFGVALLIGAGVLLSRRLLGSRK